MGTWHLMFSIVHPLDFRSGPGIVEICSSTLTGRATCSSLQGGAEAKQVASGWTCSRSLHFLKNCIFSVWLWIYNYIYTHMYIVVIDVVYLCCACLAELFEHMPKTCFILGGTCQPRYWQLNRRLHRPELPGRWHVALRSQRRFAICTMGGHCHNMVRVARLSFQALAMLTFMTLYINIYIYIYMCIYF